MSALYWSLHGRKRTCIAIQFIVTSLLALLLQRVPATLHHAVNNDPHQRAKITLGQRRLVPRILQQCPKCMHNRSRARQEVPVRLGLKRVRLLPVYL